MSKYFDFGYKTQPNHPHLALYQPTADCFFFTLDDLIQADEIKKIMSSRYSLFVCRVDTAENYNDNLIDNECCHDWTLSNKSDINIAKPYLFGKYVNVIELMQNDKDKIEQSEIKKEQEYIHMVRFWLKFSAWCKSLFDWYTLEEFMYDVIEQQPTGHSLYHEIKNIDLSIRRACYHGNNIASVETVIENQIHSMTLISDLYEQWKKDNLARSISAD